MRTLMTSKVSGAAHLYFLSSVEPSNRRLRTRTSASDIAGGRQRNPCERRHRCSGGIVDHRHVQQSDESGIGQYFYFYCGGTGGRAGNWHRNLFRNCRDVHSGQAARRQFDVHRHDKYWSDGRLGTSLASNFVWSFTTGTIPTVISTSPANGALNIPINRKITATFSEAMNPATVTTTGVFSLMVTTGGAVTSGATTFVTANSTAVFSPSVNLLPNTNYTATISTAAQSAAGNGLAAKYAFVFTTGAAADVTAPTIIATLPSSAAVSVPTNQIITATFSKPMDPSTITATGTFTVTVAGVGGAAVPGTVSYAGTIATFKPTTKLAASTQFTAKVTTAAKDLSGNALGAGVIPNPWSFTTGAGTDTTPPTITTSNPANAATSVALNATVSATFSEPMNPLTLTTAGTFTVVVAGVNGAPVNGSVTYNSLTNIATFTPAARPDGQYSVHGNS